MNKKELEQKASYFVSCMSDGFTKIQRESFDIWINDNEENKKAFKKMQNLQKLYFSISKDIKTEISKEVHEQIKKENSLKTLKKYAFAATILLCICFTAFLTKNYLDFKMTHFYETQMMTQTIILPDSSKIVLDANTQISVIYENNQRKVNLKRGKVIFKVARNTKKPFIIDTEKIRIKVLGTSFEVNNKKNKIDVEVIEGLVSIQKYENYEIKELIKLTKGKKISYNKEKDNFFLEDIDISTIGLWKNGILNFQDDTLVNAITEFKKYQDINIFLKDDVKKLTITGSFSIKEFDKFLYAIKQIHFLESSKQGNRIYIFKKN